MYRSATPVHTLHCTYIYTYIVHTLYCTYIYTYIVHTLHCTYITLYVQLHRYHRWSNKPVATATKKGVGGPWSLTFSCLWLILTSTTLDTADGRWPAKVGVALNKASTRPYASLVCGRLARVKNKSWQIRRKPWRKGKEMSWKVGDEVKMVMRRGRVVEDEELWGEKVNDEGTGKMDDDERIVDNEGGSRIGGQRIRRRRMRAKRWWGERQRVMINRVRQ